MSENITLDDGWQDACRAFYQAAGIDLKNQTAPTADVIRARYEDTKAKTKEDRRKVERIKDGLNKTLACIDRVGSIAAQGASMVFGSPATIAGSALSFFVAAGVAYRQIFGDIEELLDQVVAAFERFQVYRNDQGLLPPEMIRAANKLLVTLVQICGLCYQTLKKQRLKTFLSMTLFGDDGGVHAQLAKLHTIQVEEGHMRGALTLVATEKTRTSVETGFTHTRTQLETLSAGMQTVQARIDNREDLKYLTHTLSIPSKDLNTERYRHCVAELSTQSCQWLHHDPAYQSWSGLQRKANLLLFTGEEGVGKTYAMTAVLQDLQTRYPPSPESTHHVSIAYYYVTPPDKQGDTLSVSDAIGRLAWQIAQNNAEFRGRLVNACKQGPAKRQSAIEAMQNLIIGCTSNESISFLALDGIQNFNIDDQGQLRDMVRAFSSTWSLQGTKMLISARKRFAQQLASTIPTLANLEIAEKSQQDIHRYVTNRLDQIKIFQRQNGGTQDLKQFVSDGLSEDAQGNFLYINVLLDQIERAYDSQGVKAIVERAKHGGLLSDSIKAVMEGFNQNLNAKELEDLNTIIVWILYSAGTPTVDILESILFLKNGELPLRSIYDQITEQFSDLFTIKPDELDDDPSAASVSFKSDSIEEYFMNSSRATAHASSNVATIREIRMLRNIVEKFCDEDLYEELGLGAFFDQKISQTRTSIMMTPENANTWVTIQCLRALLDGSEELSSLREYACRNLSVHLQKVAADGSHARAEDEVGPLLVRFLTDTTCIARVAEVGWQWRLSFEDELVDEIVRLLRSPTIVKDVMASQSDERHWVLSVQNSPIAEIDVLMPAARFMSKALTAVNFRHQSINTNLPYYIDAFQWLFGLFNKRQHVEDSSRYARTHGLHLESEMAAKRSRSMHELSVDVVHEVYGFAQELLEEQTPSFEKLFRLAQIYGACGHKVTAISTLEQCLSIQPESLDVMAELASVYAPELSRVEREDYEAAIQYLTRIKKQEQELGIVDKPQYFSRAFNSQLIMCYLELQQYEEVKNIYMEKLSEDSGRIEWTRQLMLLEHKRARYGEVVKLLQTFSSQADTLQISRFWMELASGGDFNYTGDSFEAIAYSFEREGQLAWLQQACTKVLDSTIRAVSERKWTFFFSYDQLKTYLAQTLYEYPTMPEDIDRAMQLWEDVITQNRSSSFLENPAYKSATFLVPLYIQRAVQAGKGSPTCQKILEKMKAFETAALDFHDGDMLISKAMFRAAQCHCHATLNGGEAAKLAIRPDIDLGIKLLLDNDPENDWLGYKKLGSAFMSLGDDRNATAAWRLIGPTVDDSEKDGVGSSQATKATTLTLTTQQGEEQPGEHIDSLFPLWTEQQNSGPMDSFGCGGQCGRQWTFADDIRICRICPNVRLDSKCYEKFRAGSWKPSSCNFQHEYFHVPPWDAASSARVEARTVLVGGKEMPFVQWLAEIAREWGIES